MGVFINDVTQIVRCSQHCDARYNGVSKIVSNSSQKTAKTVLIDNLNIRQLSNYTSTKREARIVKAKFCSNNLNLIRSEPLSPLRLGFRPRIIGKF